MRLTCIVFATFLWAPPSAAAACTVLEMKSPSAGLAVDQLKVTAAACVPDAIRTVRFVVKDASNTETYASRPIDLGRGQSTVSAVVALTVGPNKVLVRDANSTAESAAIDVTSTGIAPGSDDRDDFEASFYTGLSIDTFAANDLLKYLNFTEAEGRRERYIAGIDFSYRLLGKKSDPRSPQLWIYGETLHGARSAEVDCTQENSRPPVCATGTNPLNTDLATLKPGQQLVYLIRNASSLEAYTGLRFEFLTLNPRGAHPAKLYLKGQAGFVTVSKNGGDVIDLHHVGIGALSTAGRYQGSYLELGYGRSDFFVTNRYKRLKVDAYLTFHPNWMSKRRLEVSPFFQITVDSDMRRGADSVQSFIGLNFDFSKLL